MTTRFQHRYFLIAIFVLLAAALLALVYPRLQPEKPIVEVNLALADCAQTSEINEATLSYADIKQTRLAIMQGQFSEAGQQIHQAYQQSKIGCWRFLPFTPYLNAAVDNDSEELWQQLNLWVEQEPQSIEARLARVTYAYQYSWAVRGSRYVSKTAAGRLEGFKDWLLFSQADSHWLLEREPNNPYVVFMALQTQLLLEERDFQLTAFNQAVEKMPHYVALYTMQLRYLAPRWGGSVNAMQTFTEQVLSNVELGSARTIVRLNYYQLLLTEINRYCSRFPVRNRPACLRETLESMDGEELTQQTIAVIEHLVGVSNQEANLQVASYLSSISALKSADIPFQNLLNVFAAKIGKQVSLEQTKATSNHYLVNHLLGEYWLKRDKVDIALSFFEQALADVDQAVFVSEGLQQQAQIFVINSQIQAYAKLKQFQPILQLADRLQLITAGHVDMVEKADIICEAYFRQNQFQKAIEFCTQASEATSDQTARYFRGESYHQLAQYDLAIADYNKVLARTDFYGLKLTSIISLALSYEKSVGLERALEVMNHYEEMILGNLSTKSYKTNFYNNRCYFKMELGQLQSALDDCNRSLEYGQLKITLDKQKKLKEMLEKSL